MVLLSKVSILNVLVGREEWAKMRLDTGETDDEVPELHFTLLMREEGTLCSKTKPYCTVN